MSWQIHLVFFATAALFACVGAAAVFLALRALRRSRAARSWPRAEGRIVSAAVKEVTAMAGEGHAQTCYVPAVEYEYFAGGRAFLGDRINFGLVRGGSYSSAQQTVARYCPGTAVSVVYDPAAPELAALEAATSAAPAIILLLAGFVFGFLAVGVTGVWAATALAVSAQALTVDRAEVSRVGNWSFSVPAGWRSSQSSGVATLSPLSLARGEDVRIIIFPGESVEADRRAQFYRFLRRNDSRVNEQVPLHEGGNGGFYTVLITPNGAEQRYTMYYGIPAGTRFQFIIFTAGSEALADRHAAALPEFVKTIRVQPELTGSGHVPKSRSFPESAAIFG
ncbi:MAG: DUF3592 domain-containing protein [Bryobacteraceae bacterium]|nr:DUF3592 domain-containing protein [Bryobacteraceae bacterium]